MSDLKATPVGLQVREQKMQARRKQTPWREFVKEICSWMPMMFYKNNGLITPYCKDIKKFGNIINPIAFEIYRQNIPEIEYTGDLVNSLITGFQKIDISGIKVLGQNENSEYNYIILGAKNAYLSIVVVNSQNVLYSYSVFNSSNIYNSVLVESSDNVYHARSITKSSNIFFSSSIESSSNILFGANLIGCSFCYNCQNLNNQSYCINNQFVGKQVYEGELKRLNKNKKSFLEQYKKTIAVPGENLGENIKGSFNKNCQDIEQGCFNYQLKNARNTILCNASETIESVIDCCSLGGIASDNIYASMGVGYNSHNVYCSVECSPNCSSIYYSYLMDTCSYCLGCIGLKNKSFCILNKQYEKEEWFAKANEIFAQMDADGTLGAFFPASMNPFYFNDTVAYLIDDSFTKEEVTKEGYLRRDEEIKVDIPEGSEIVETQNLASRQGFDEKGERTINPDILKKVIRDPKGNVYRIQKMEYDFLMKHGLPLPELHWLDRIKLGFKFK